MNELVTLERSHPDFLKYLWGTFSKDKRALPVKSLNIRTEQERVTFRLLPLRELPRPNFFVVWMKALRPRAFLQILVPMLLILTLAESRGLLTDPDLPWLASLGLLSLFASLLFANDVQDHLTGADRVREDRGSRALQKGWLTASALNLASRILLVFALIFALPLLFAVPELLWFVLPAVLLGAGTFYRRGESYKDLTHGPFVLFVLGGPLLALGYQTAVTARFDLQGALLGALWGWLLLFSHHLRDLSQLVTEGRGGLSKNWVSRLGFDRSLRLIQVWWLAGLAAFVAYHAASAAPFWFWVFLFLLVLSSVRFVKSLRALKSPAGSAVEQVRRQGEFYFHALSLLWVLESLWRIRG